LAKKLGVGLQFLPSCAPNLNLIERLREFVKKHTLNSLQMSEDASILAG
jgi:hypothetical protein